MVNQVARLSSAAVLEVWALRRRAILAPPAQLRDGIDRLESLAAAEGQDRPGITCRARQ